MTGRTKGILGALVALVVVGGAAVWWFVLRDDAPERASLGDDTTTDVSVEAGATPDGTWVVAAGEGAGDDVFVGYRIEELFGGDTIKKTAVGRTPAVEGTLTIDGATVSDVEITADLTQLASDQGRRDGYLRGNALETDTVGEASFTLTEPIELSSAPAPGATVTATATGDLTLHGVTQPVEVEVEARWDGDTLRVAGSAPITLADFEIETPEISGFVAVDDAGEMEWELTFVPA